MKTSEETQRSLVPACSPSREESTNKNSDTALNQARRKNLLAEINALKREIARRTRELAAKQKEYRSLAISLPESRREEAAAPRAENQETARWWLRSCESRSGIEAAEDDSLK